MLRVGVVGVGVWGCHSLERTLAATGRATVTAVSTCERWGAHQVDGDVAAFGRQYAADLGAGFVEDWHELLCRDDVDVVSVMVCPRHKAEVIEACLGLNKHVVTDKPLAMTSAESARLVEVEADSEGRGFVLAGYQDRPGVRDLIELTRSGRFGASRAVCMRLCFMGGLFPGFVPTARWRSEIPSAEMTTIGCHALMTLMQLHPAPAETVYARTTNRFYPEYAEVGAEDWAELSLTFRDGAVASILVSRLPYRVPGDDMTIHLTGTQGAAAVEGGVLTTWPGACVQPADDASEDHLIRVMNRVVDAFENHTAAPVTLAQAHRLQRLLDAALASARRKSAVTVADVAHL